MELVWDPSAFRQPGGQQARGAAERGAGQPDPDARKYQLFFYAGEAAALRACWGKLSDRKKKELVHFDRDAQQRDLMEALVQSFGYAPRFLAACHAFLTARETYKLAQNIQRYFIRWADGKTNPRDPAPREAKDTFTYTLSQRARSARPRAPKAALVLSCLCPEYISFCMVS